jgi:thymidylate synthase ThyX
MNVTQVAISPTRASQEAGRPALTPELLAASGARYSRNNEGLESILSRIDPENPDKSVDSIFRMLDYGHQSIADMAPVAMFIDGISLWLAYHVWSLCPTASGQESSTRYINYSAKEAVPPEELGITGCHSDAWRALISECYDGYAEALALWQEIVDESPALTRIPAELLNDSSEKTQKKVARMKRNYAFDRARYFLPVSAPTNVMLLMSARAWTSLIQYLLSHPLPESRELGRLLREELSLTAPRLVKHATIKPSLEQGIAAEIDQERQLSLKWDRHYLLNETSEAHPPAAFLESFMPQEMTADAKRDLQFHDNRYAWIGPGLRRTAVRFGWQAVAMAELRDLNRHRTGSKWCPLIPRGFYCAADQLPHKKHSEALTKLATIGRRAASAARALLECGDPAYIYWTMLGTQYYFEHTTTADKFLYEAELRTGTGAHYRYAKHLHDALEIWYQQYPETKGLVLEGSAEPE